MRWADMGEIRNGVVGVGSSNLPAPTNKKKGLGDKPKSFFMYEAE
jgi:hypothetical protein